MYNGTAAMKNNMAFPQKLQIALPYDNNSALSVCPRIKSKTSSRYLFAHVYSSIIYENQSMGISQVFLRGLVDKQNMINKQWNIIIKMNEILTHSTMWVNPHDIMLSDSTA